MPPMSTVVVSTRPLRDSIRTLQEFEGRRCLWRVPVAAMTYLLIRAVPFAAAITVALIAVNARVAAAVFSVAIGLTFDALAKRLRDRLPWRAVIDNRLWSYEKPNVITEVAVLVGTGHAPAARHALRVAKFSPSPYSTNVGTPPEDAPDLTVRLSVQEPEAWPQSSSDKDRVDRIVSALRGGGSIRARVGGVDVFPEGTRLPRKGEARALVSEGHP